MIRRVLLSCMAFTLIQAGLASAAPNVNSLPPKYGPAGAPFAAPLWQYHEYFQSAKNPAPDFWKLITHYTGQSNSLSCSVAAVAMVLNAIARTQEGLRTSDVNFQQAKLIADVKSVHWKERVAGSGWEGRAGLTLAELAEVVSDALKTYGIKGWTTSFRSFENAGPKALDELRAILEANEASADDYVILHFLQDKLTNDPGGPYAHISPVGAYDAASGRVLVLDVDREYYGPYWVGVERLLTALSAQTLSYGHGGVLIVRRISR
ncbi:MAG: phytochelatin synthase family protein [Syntrophales bacterium]